jgi:hypothetical protein
MTNVKPAMGESSMLTINPPTKPISRVLAHKAMTSESPIQSVSIVVIYIYFANGLTRKTVGGYGFNKN